MLLVAERGCLVYWEKLKFKVKYFWVAHVQNRTRV